MKFKILLGTVVLGIGLCTQSFGFELLDRMLGVSQKDGKGGCGCSQKSDGGKGGACQKGDCGLLRGNAQKGGKDGKGGCGNGCSQKGKDGCSQKGKDGKGGACQKGGGLFGGNAQKGGKGGRGNGCSQKGDGKGGSKGCGCRTSLLDRLFACNMLDRLFACNSCGKGDKGGSSDSDGVAESPMPPAPVIDPSAFLWARRPVIQATSYLR